MQTQCLAVAKLVENKKLNTVRVLVSFDRSKRDQKGNIVITARNAAYVSGDICNTADSKEYKQLAIARTLKNAAAALRTTNIVFV